MATHSVPESLGPYTIESRLGSGGFATVYKARRDEAARPVALKVLHEQFARDPQRVMALEREVRRLVGLAHPNLVSVIGFEELDHGQYGMVMQYVEGPTLTEVLHPEVADEQSDLTQFYGDAAEGTVLSIAAPACNAPSIGEIASIASAVAAALEYVHAAGIYHLDVKPDNILLSRETALLTDFGIAQALDDDRSEHGGLRAGTPAYSSPEQVRGDPLDGRSDIYSLGVVLYEMLTGHPPFAGATTRAILEQHLIASPTMPSKIRPDTPRALENVLMKCLQKEPARRYQTAGELRSALRVAVKETTGTARLYDEWYTRTRRGSGEAKCSLCGHKFERRSLHDDCPQCALRRRAGVCVQCGLVWQTARPQAHCPVCGWIWQTVAAEAESRRLLQEARGFIEARTDVEGEADNLRVYGFKHHLLPELQERACVAQAKWTAALQNGSVVLPAREGAEKAHPEQLSAMRDLLNLVHLWESAPLDRFVASQELEVLRRRQVAELTACAERLRGLFFSSLAAAGGEPGVMKAYYEMAKKWHWQSAEHYALAGSQMEAAARFSVRLTERVLAFADDPTQAESRELWKSGEDIQKIAAPGTQADLTSWMGYDQVYTRLTGEMNSAAGQTERSLSGGTSAMSERNLKLEGLRDSAQRELERVEQGCEAASDQFGRDIGRFGRLGRLARWAVVVGPIFVAALMAVVAGASFRPPASWLGPLWLAPVVVLPSALAYLWSRREQPLRTRKSDISPLLGLLIASWLVLIVSMSFFGLPNLRSFLAYDRQLLVGSAFVWVTLAGAWIIHVRLAPGERHGLLFRVFQLGVWTASFALVVAYALAIYTWIPLATWWLPLAAFLAILLGTLGGRTMAAIADAEAIARQNELLTLAELARSSESTLTRIEADQRHCLEESAERASSLIEQANKSIDALEMVATGLSARRFYADAAQSVRPVTEFRTRVETLREYSANPDTQVISSLEKYIQHARERYREAKASAEAEYHVVEASSDRMSHRRRLLAGSLSLLLVLIVWSLASVVVLTPPSRVPAGLARGLAAIRSQPFSAAIAAASRGKGGTPPVVQTVRAISVDRPTVVRTIVVRTTPEPTLTGVAPTITPQRSEVGGLLQHPIVLTAQALPAVIQTAQVGKLPIVLTAKALPAAAQTVWVRELPTGIANAKVRTGLATPAPVLSRPPLSTPTGLQPLPTFTVTPMRPSPSSAAPATSSKASVAKVEAEVTAARANVRQGPGTSYAVLGGMNKGTRVQIIARSPESDWWLVCCLNKQNVWIANSVVRVSGSVDNIPVATPTVKK